jgi:hypothetical protein
VRRASLDCARHRLPVVIAPAATPWRVTEQLGTDLRQGTLVRNARTDLPAEMFRCFTLLD